MLRRIRRPTRPEPLPLNERPSARPAVDGVWLNVRPRGRFAAKGDRKPSLARLAATVLATLAHKGRGLT